MLILNIKLNVSEIKNKMLPEKKHSTDGFIYFQLHLSIVFCIHILWLSEKGDQPCSLKKQHKTSNIFKVYSTLDQICHNFKLLPKYFCNPLLVNRIAAI